MQLFLLRYILFNPLHPTGDYAALRPRARCALPIISLLLYTCLIQLRAAQKGNFCVMLDSKILMYISTLRFSHLRKP